MSTGTFARQWGEQSGFFPGTKSLLDKVQQENDPVVAPFATQMVEGGASRPGDPALRRRSRARRPSRPCSSRSCPARPRSTDASDKAATEMDDIFAKG